MSRRKKETKSYGKFKEESPIYSPEQIDEFLTCAGELPTIKTTKKITYINCPCAFDIETTSFMDHGEKAAIMYEWTFGINGAVMIGRSIYRFMDVLMELRDHFQLTHDKRLVCYVHNLSFEFQFIRKYFAWDEVFSLDERKPAKALNDLGIEFRCSYILSGKSLSKLGNDLQKYKVQKMDGDLDYSLLRHTETPLTDKELKYCENDVRVVMAFVQEEIERNGNITKIPMTKTGYVRRFCRNNCLYPKGGKHAKNSNEWRLYHNLMKALTITPEEYNQLQRAFQGGFTHGNAWECQRINYNVASFDFCSSYPAVMVSERFPMSKSEIVKIESKEQLYDNLKKYCCLFDIVFYGLKSKNVPDHPLSLSRSAKVINAQVDNGRVASADEIATTLTEQDFFIMEQFYTWEAVKIGTFRRYKRGYLPKAFVESILELYRKKTELKGVAGMEQEYMLSKEMLNSCYGMIVTNICRPENTYNDIDGWGKKQPDTNAEIEKYNDSKGRFLYYPWGVWVTAYARRNLFSGIKAFGSDYIYSDTDSIKAVNHEDHMEYITAYNDYITGKIERAMESLKIPVEYTRPKTIQGQEKKMGLWEFEGIYNKFKFLGAKRYLTETDGKIEITVAGLGKRIAAEYLKENFTDVFKSFDDDLYIPKDKTGKNIHTYIDYEVFGELTDYTGKKAYYEQLSGVHLDGAEYSLSLSQSYIDYLNGIREIT